MRHFGPPLTAHRTDDPAGNLAAWAREWRRVHPAVRWMVGYWMVVAAWGGMIVGFVLGVLVG